MSEQVKYGAKPGQVSKTASGNPGTHQNAPKPAQTLQEKLDRKKKQTPQE